MNDSVDMPVKKKRKQSDTRMLTALQLRYRAIQDTDKSVIDDSTYWLIQGGYTEEDTETKEKNKKRAKTTRSPASKDKQTVSGTPNKKQAAKSAEKLSIEEDIAVTENVSFIFITIVCFFSILLFFVPCYQFCLFSKSFRKFGNN